MSKTIVLSDACYAELQGQICAAPTPTPTPAPTPTPPNPTPTPSGTIVLPWPTPAQGYTRTVTKNSTNDTVTVFQFTVPADAPNAPLMKGGKVMASYSTAQQPNRQAVLSLTPGDFSSPLAPGANIKSSQSPQVPFTINVADSYYPMLQPGVTYYFNVKNLNCPVGADCNMYCDLHRPGA